MANLELSPRVPNVFCVRADYGTYTQHFLKGGYAAIGWNNLGDLTGVRSKEEIKTLYRKAEPEETSNAVIGQQAGQVERFLLEMRAGDIVVTPSTDSESLHYGTVENGAYHFDSGSDGCRFRHRRPVKWSKDLIRRGDLSVPLQNTLRSSLTVFRVEGKDELFIQMGLKELVSAKPVAAYDPYATVVSQLLVLDPKEFEVLITQLLSALGFDGKHTGKPGDGGVDAIGDLDVANLAKVRIYVQAKRYKVGTRIRAKVVKELRQNLPDGTQGAFITTADFTEDAHAVATEPGFRRIGLVNGRQLVDLLVAHWQDIDEAFRIKLGLKPGLVLA